jgi:hypothetical protein
LDVLACHAKLLAPRPDLMPDRQPSVPQRVEDGFDERSECAGGLVGEHQEIKIARRKQRTGTPTAESRESPAAPEVR